MEQRPKRRKHKDNPYTLSYENKTVSFKDITGKLRIVIVSEEVFNSMDRFELDDKAELNEYARHLEHSEIYDESLYNRVLEKPESLEDEVIKKSTFEDLHRAIKQLPIVQQRRIKKYYFDEMTQQEIAEEEQVDIRAIQYTLKTAIDNLKKNLKN